MVVMSARMKCACGTLHRARSICPAEASTPVILNPARNQIAGHRHAGSTAEIEHMSARGQEIGELAQLACTHCRVAELLKVAVGDLVISSRDELCDAAAAQSQSPPLGFPEVPI